MLVLVVLIVVPLVLLGLWIAVQAWRESRLPDYDPETMPLHAVELGQGQERVFPLHGLQGSHNYWAGRADALLPDHRLLIPDCLGFGQSPKPRSTYDLAQHTAALAALLRQRDFHRQVMLVGHSTGAILAISLLAQHPAWFKGAVLVGTPVIPDRQTGIQHLGSLGAMYKGTLEKDPLIHLSCYTRELLQKLPVAKVVGVPQDVFHDAMLHTWNSLSQTLNNTIIGAPLADLLTRIDKPILFIHGENDRVAPPAPVRDLVQGRTNRRYLGIPNAGHQLFLDDPAAFWSHFRAFEASL